MDDKIVNLELTLKEVNSILTFLGEMKYNQVAAIISKVQSQALSQVNPGINTSVKSSDV